MRVTPGSMADPHHVPELDAHDRLTVALYRGGLAVAAVGLCALALTHGADLDRWVPVAELLVLLGTAAAIANMHLYAKTIRWVIGAAGWTGAVLLVTATALPSPTAAHWVHHGGLGFVFVALSAFALKEQFCFRIPLLRAVPLFLAVSLLPMLGDRGLATAILLAPAALTYLALAWAKVRMPLHFDVGDKSKYQV